MIVRIFAVLVLLIYPFAVWQLLERGMIASAALFLAVAALLSACIKRSPIGFICVACALVLAFCAGVLDMQNALKLYPRFRQRRTVYCLCRFSQRHSHGGNLCATSA